MIKTRFDVLLCDSYSCVYMLFESRYFFDVLVKRFYTLTNENWCIRSFPFANNQCEYESPVLLQHWKKPISRIHHFFGLFPLNRKNWNMGNFRWFREWCRETFHQPYNKLRGFFFLNYRCCTDDNHRNFYSSSIHCLKKKNIVEFRIYILIQIEQKR